MKYEILADKIIYFKNALPDPKGWLEDIENADTPLISSWLPWEKYTEESTGYMKKYGFKKMIYGDHILTHKVEDFPNDAFNRVSDLANAIDKCCDIYAKTYGVEIKERLNKNMYLLSKYDSDSVIDLQHHIDIEGEWEEYSILVYINSDYEGGELELTNFNINLKPQSGSIIIFPSGDPYVHAAQKSYNGQKYFIAHFWQQGAGAGFSGLSEWPSNMKERSLPQ